MDRLRLALALVILNTKPRAASIHDHISLVRKEWIVARTESSATITAPSSVPYEPRVIDALTLWGSRIATCSASMSIEIKAGTDALAEMFLDISRSPLPARIITQAIYQLVLVFNLLASYITNYIIFDTADEGGIVDAVLLVNSANEITIWSTNVAQAILARSIESEEQLASRSTNQEQFWDALISHFSSCIILASVYLSNGVSPSATIQKALLDLVQSVLQPVRAFLRQSPLDTGFRLGQILDRLTETLRDEGNRLKTMVADPSQTRPRTCMIACDLSRRSLAAHGLLLGDLLKNDAAAVSMEHVRGVSSTLTALLVGYKMDEVVGPEVEVVLLSVLEIAWTIEEQHGFL